MSLSIEERRRKLRRSLASLGFWLLARGVAEILVDGNHAPEKLKTMVPPRWELYGQPGSMRVMALLRQPPGCALPEPALDYNALREAT
jgi:hypothetical protein